MWLLRTPEKIGGGVGCEDGGRDYSDEAISVVELLKAPEKRLERILP